MTDKPRSIPLSILRLVYRREIRSSHLKVWDWYRRPHAVDRLNPYFPRLQVIRRPVHLFTGAVLLMRLQWLGLSRDLRFEHESHEVGRSFCEKMVRGPLLLWRHQHEFVPWKADSTLLEDRLEIVATRFETLNRWLHSYLERRLDRLFNWRHHISSFDLDLWHQQPFVTSQLHLLHLNRRQKELCEALKAALEPIPSAENDPANLIQIHEGGHVILNTLGWRGQKLPAHLLQELARVHAHTLICLGHAKRPRWLELLDAYGDRVIYIQVAGWMLSRWMQRGLRWALRLGWRPKAWCCEEDLLSCVFQILHERLTTGHFSLGAPPRPAASALRRHLGLDPSPYLPPFPLKQRAFSSIEQWLAIYGKL